MENKDEEDDIKPEMKQKKMNCYFEILGQAWPEKDLLQGKCISLCNRVRGVQDDFQINFPYLWSKYIYNIISK